MEKRISSKTGHSLAHNGNWFAKNILPWTVWIFYIDTAYNFILWGLFVFIELFFFFKETISVLCSSYCDVNYVSGVAFFLIRLFKTSKRVSHSVVVPLCDSMDCSHQAPLSMEFSRQEYWSGLPFPSAGELSDPGTEPRSPILQADSLPTETPGKTWNQWKDL